MKVRNLIALIAFTAVPAAVVGIASATPPSGVSAVAQVVGAQLTDPVKVNADGIKFQTKRPSEASVLTLTVEPGGSTGWHTHPGFAVIAVAEGTGKLYATDCTAREFSAGEAFVESGDDAATLFRNEGSVPVILTVTFISPRGSALNNAIIVDEPAPSTCGLL